MAIVLRLGVVLAGFLFLMVCLLPSTGCDSPPELDAHYATSRALMEVERNVYSYRDAEDRVPGETIEEIVANLENFGAKFEEGQIDLLHQGVDGWGKPLILEQQSESKWVLRSRGANGMDDHGSGDDIEREFNLAPYSESETKSGPCACCQPVPAASSVDPGGPQPTPAAKEEA